MSLFDSNKLINIENKNKSNKIYIINHRYKLDNLFEFNNNAKIDNLTELNRVKLELRKFKINSFFNMKRKKIQSCFKLLNILKSILFIN